MEQNFSGVNDRLYRILHDSGQHNEDAELLISLGEAREAQSFQGEPMTVGQLADLMEVERDEEGKIPRVPFLNACLRAHEFDGIKGLSREERIRAMSTAFDFLGDI